MRESVIQHLKKRQNKLNNASLLINALNSSKCKEQTPI